MSTDVNTDDLRKDSKTWAEAAQKLEGPINTAKNLNLLQPPAYDVTIWGVNGGVDGAYHDLHFNMIDLMTKAETCFNDIAKKLAAAAKTYDGIESDNKSAFKVQDEGLGG